MGPLPYDDAVLSLIVSSRWLRIAIGQSIFTNQFGTKNQHTSSLEEDFRQHPVACINEAMSKIHDLTGISLHLTKVREFLKSLGINEVTLG